MENQYYLQKKECDHKTKQTEKKTTLLDSSWLFLFVGDPKMEIFNATA